MLKRIVTRWKALMSWIDEFPHQRSFTLKDVIEGENKIDELEIKQAERAIVNHQYLLHMAQQRIKARKLWDQLQAERHGLPSNQVRPTSEVQTARSKRLA